MTNVEVESSPELQHVKKVRTDLEIEVFSFEQDEGTTNQLREEIVRQAVEHLDLNLTEDQLDDEIAITPGVSRLQSPEIAIPGIPFCEERKMEIFDKIYFNQSDFLFF